QESALWKDGLPQVAIERLRESGFLKERDGALWFGSALEEEDGLGEQVLAEDEDRVVIRSNGEPTYFASDIGYLLSRFEQRHFNPGLTAAERHPRLREEADMSLLAQPWELDVARQLAFWPEVVEDAARLMEPHRIPYYVHDLATAVHRFYHAGNEDGAHRVVV